MKRRIAILFSGNGSNMEAIIRELHQKEVEGMSIEVVATITNNPNARGIERCERLGIPCEVIDHRAFETREAFDEAIVARLKNHKVDLTILAGFMRILTPVFVHSVKALNIHPSLLPLFKGAHAIKESYESPMKVAGVSVHYVSDELDGGELIAQEAIAKIEGEGIEAFEARIHALEHRLYPRAIIQALKAL